MLRLIQRHSRLVIIYLITVVLTGSLLTYLGINSIANYRELTEKRIFEEQNKILADYFKGFDHVTDSLGRHFSLLLARDSLVSGHMLIPKKIADYNYLVVDSNGSLLDPLMIDPGITVSIKPNRTFTSQYRLGESEEFARNNPVGAISEYERSLIFANNDSDSAMAYNAMARAYLKRGLEGKANSYYQLIIKDFGLTVNASGMPFAYLATHQLLKNVDESTRSTMRMFLLGLLHNRVPFSDFTPGLLDNICNSTKVSVPAMDSLCLEVRKKYLLALDFRDKLKDHEIIYREDQAPGKSFLLMTGESKENFMFLKIMQHANIGIIVTLKAVHQLIMAWLRLDDLMFDVDIRLRPVSEGQAEGTTTLRSIEEFPLTGGAKIVEVKISDEKEVDRYVLKRELLTASGLVLIIIVILLGFYLLLADIKRKRKMDLLRADFVANVTHELKTPLTSIHMFADSILMGKAKSEERLNKYAHVILKESEKLKHMVNNILEFSRKENEGLNYVLVETKLDRLVEDIINETTYWLEINKFDLKKEIMQDIYAMVDPEGLKQVMSNLISNAIKYSDITRELTIRLYENSDHALIDIEDQGIGIPKEEQSLVFTKFYRVDEPEAERVSGTGLGLTVSKDIIEAMGGKLLLKSEPGKGSTFTIVLNKTHGDGN